MHNEPEKTLIEQGRRRRHQIEIQTKCQMCLLFLCVNIRSTGLETAFRPFCPFCPQFNSISVKFGLYTVEILSLQCSTLFVSNTVLFSRIKSNMYNFILTEN